MRAAQKFYCIIFQCTNCYFYSRGPGWTLKAGIMSHYKMPSLKERKNEKKNERFKMSETLFSLRMTVTMTISFFFFFLNHWKKVKLLQPKLLCNFLSHRLYSSALYRTLQADLKNRLFPCKLGKFSTSKAVSFQCFQCWMISLMYFLIFYPSKFQNSGQKLPVLPSFTGLHNRNLLCLFMWIHQGSIDHLK